MFPKSSRTFFDKIRRLLTDRVGFQLLGLRRVISSSFHLGQYSTDECAKERQMMSTRWNQLQHFERETMQLIRAMTRPSLPQFRRIPLAFGGWVWLFSFKFFDRRSFDYVQSCGRWLLFGVLRNYDVLGRWGGTYLQNSTTSKGNKSDTAILFGKVKRRKVITSEEGSVELINSQQNKWIYICIGRSKT